MATDKHLIFLTMIKIDSKLFIYEIFVLVDKIHKTITCFYHKLSFLCMLQNVPSYCLMHLDYFYNNSSDENVSCFHLL